MLYDSMLEFPIKMEIWQKGVVLVTTFGLEKAQKKPTNNSHCQPFIWQKNTLSAQWANWYRGVCGLRFHWIQAHDKKTHSSGKNRIRD